jgi:hypothetical protein
MKISMQSINQPSISSHVDGGRAKGLAWADPVRGYDIIIFSVLADGGLRSQITLARPSTHLHERNFFAACVCKVNFNQKYAALSCLSWTPASSAHVEEAKLTSPPPLAVTT